MHFTPYKEKKGEEYMNSDQEAHFSRILENWRLLLMKEVDRTVDHMKDDAANFPDPNDRASQETEFSIELRTRDRERKLLKKITETLDLIDGHHSEPVHRMQNPARNKGKKLWLNRLPAKVKRAGSIAGFVFSA